MGFDELARELDSLYSREYTDRETALRKFGTDHEPALRRVLENGPGLPELVDAARIGGTNHWAGYIREGMGIAVHLREV